MTSQGRSVAQAAPIGLLAVALSTLIGTIEGLFKKIVRYRAAIWIALIGALWHISSIFIIYDFLLAHVNV